MCKGQSSLVSEPFSRRMDRRSHHAPTDRRVGEESLEQPWLRGMRLRLCPSPPAPARTLWALELMVLSAVLVSTRPGEPLRLPASSRERGGKVRMKPVRQSPPDVRTSLPNHLLTVETIQSIYIKTASRWKEGCWGTRDETNEETYSTNRICGI